jgi:hypothetical protein
VTFSTGGPTTARTKTFQRFEFTSFSTPALLVVAGVHW